ncbi:hypothetical protein CMT45_00070 [Elizabethkingia anophelis]|nr:hypothetical protein [Elizabethkingia anophelis]
MENNENKNETSKIDKNILEFNEQQEIEKEERLLDLIIEIIVSSTLKEYYETSNKIPAIQPNRTK